MTYKFRMWIFTNSRRLPTIFAETVDWLRRMVQLRSASIPRIVLTVSVLASVSGCGGDSVEDRMMARAQAKAAMLEAEAAEEAALAAASPPPPPPPPPPPVAAVVASPVPTTEIASPSTEPAPVVAETVPVVTADPPPVMALDQGGRLLAFDRGESRIGLFDMQKKQLVRTVGSQEFSPSVFALDPGGRRLITADNLGNVQTFSVDEVSGLDAFERRRRRGQNASSGQFAHARPVTAIATVGYAGGYVTGDDAGDVRLWSVASPEIASITAGDDQVVGIQAYGDGKFLFAAIEQSNSSEQHPSNQGNSAGKSLTVAPVKLAGSTNPTVAKTMGGKIVFWRLADGLLVADSRRDYVETVGVPTRMVQSVGGGGLAVGDTSGQVRVWAPQNGKIQQSVLSPSSAPVTGLAFLEGARGIVTADAQGNVRQFSLPVVQRRDIDLPSADVRLLGVTDDSKGVLLSAGESVVELGIADSKVKRRYNVASGRAITDVCSLATKPSRLVAAATSEDSIEFFEAATGTNLGKVSLGGQVSVMTPLSDDRSVAFATQSGRFGRIIAPSQSFSLPQTGSHSMLATDSLSDQVVLVAKENRLIRVYDAADGSIVASTSLASMPGELTSLAIRDGVVVFGSDQGELWVWQSGQQRSRPIALAKLPKAKALRSIHIANEGHMRVVDDSGAFRTLNIAEMTDEAIGAASSVQFAASATKISLGDIVAVSATGDEVSLIEKDSTEASRTKLPRGNVSAVAASPVTAQFVVANDQGDMWLSTKAELSTAIQLPQGFVCRHVVWSSDGRTIIASDGRRIVTIDSSTRKLVAEHGEPEGVAELYPRAAGGAVIVDASGAVRGRFLASIAWSADDPVRIKDFAYRSADSSILAATETGELWVIDPQSGSVTISHQITEKGLVSVDMLASGLVLALEDGSGRILDCTDPAAPRPWRDGSVPTASRIVTRDQQSRVATIGADGRVSVVDIADPNATPLAITIEGTVEDLAFLDSSTLAVKTTGKASLQIIPIDENGRGMGTSFSTVSDLIGMPSGNAIAIADASSSVTIMDLGTNQSKTLRSNEGLSINRLAVNLAGTRLAAYASSAKRIGAGDTLLVWDLTQNESSAREIELPSAATAVAFSVDGSRLHVAISDKTVRSFSTTDGSELERRTLPNAARVLNSISRGSVWAGTDAGLAVQLPNQLERQLSKVDGPVRYLSAIPNRYVLAVTDQSVTIQTLETNESTSPKMATLAKGELKPLAVEIRADGEAVAISFDGDAPHVDVWKLGREIAWGSDFEPSVVVPLKSPSDALHFLSDSKLIIGQRSGVIELCDLMNQKPAFQFVGHASPIAALAVAENGNQLISCSAERSVRRWTIPVGTLAGKDADIPQANAIASTELNELPEASAEPEDVPEDDAFADVRAALLTGSGVSSEGEVFSLFEDDAKSTGDVATKYSELKEMEAAVESGSGDRSSAIAKLASARRDFHDQRRNLGSLRRAAGAKTFADNQPNLLFSAETKFDFSSGIRTVEPQLSDGRFVYAATSRSAQQPGSLYVWDFGVTGVQTHAWDDLQLNVRELFGLPDGRGVLIVPDLHVFSQDGTSRPILEALRYATSSADSQYGDTRLFAIANRGIAGRESTALQVFRSEDLMRQSAAPIASLRGFESEITSMAFANTHRAIVFSVRERNGYRLLLADPTTLDPRQITLVEEGASNKPWLIPPDTETELERGVPGPTTLAFSPDDSLLVVHTQLSQEKYAYSVYKFSWPGEGLPSKTAMSRFVGPVEHEGPFFDENSNRPLFFVTRRLTPEERVERGASFANSNVIAFRNGNNLQVVNSFVGSTVRTMPLLTSSGRPRYAVTDDGQWMITADDRGSVRLGNLGTGKTYDLTSDGRPAHSGPVVGVAISDTDSALQVPEYAVTVGEENRLKVWDLLSRLRP